MAAAAAAAAVPAHNGEPGITLLEAIKKGDADGVRAALAAGASPNTRDRFDDFALMNAAREGNLAIIRLLI